tara:strand:- start:117 stop:299 length:183 start_codon:yes stop_codon:yes gene_type:complete
MGINTIGGMWTFAAVTKSKGQREESGRSGYQPDFSVMQTQRTAVQSANFRRNGRRLDVVG